MAIQLTYPTGSALVAGGTGSIGSGITRQLALAGLPVTFTYCGNEARAKTLEQTLRAEGLNVFAYRMDLCDPASIDAAIKQTVANGGRLHTVACAAGAQVPFNAMADFSIEEIEQFFATDAMAYYKLFHRVIPVLRAGGGGTITATTTMALQRVIAYDGISSFSKGAVEAALRQLAGEEAVNGIRCNAVPIGWVGNFTIEMMRGMIAHMPSPIAERFQALIEQINSSIRLGRAGTPEEAGNLFAFLASDQASYITGQRIAMDGGALL